MKENTLAKKTRAILQPLKKRFGIPSLLKINWPTKELIFISLKIDIKKLVKIKFNNLN